MSPPLETACSLNWAMRVAGERLRRGEFESALAALIGVPTYSVFFEVSQYSRRRRLQAGDVTIGPSLVVLCTIDVAAGKSIADGMGRALEAMALDELSTALGVTVIAKSQVTVVVSISTANAPSVPPWSRIEDWTPESASWIDELATPCAACGLFWALLGLFGVLLVCWAYGAHKSRAKTRQEEIDYENTPGPDAKPAPLAMNPAAPPWRPGLSSRPPGHRFDLKTASRAVMAANQMAATPTRIAPRQASSASMIGATPQPPAAGEAANDTPGAVQMRRQIAALSTMLRERQKIIDDAMHAASTPERAMSTNFGASMGPAGGAAPSFAGMMPESPPAAGTMGLSVASPSPVSAARIRLAAANAELERAMCMSTLSEPVSTPIHLAPMQP